MRSTSGVAAKSVLAGVALLMIGYLAVLAAWPQVSNQAPESLQWFGRPNSAVTIAMVTAVLVLLAVTLSRSRAGSRAGAPVAIVVGLALISAVLGVASYWRCQDDTHPDFFTALLWTAGLVKGGSPEQSLDAGVCPSPMPVALHIAQLSALAAVFLSVIGVAVAVFRSRLDRLRAHFAHSVTAVVDPDDDASSMLDAIVRTCDRSVLVVLTDDAERRCIRTARTRGALVLTVDFDHPETYTSLSIWRRLDKLYLLAPDPSTNLQRLCALNDEVSETPDKRRVPLIVRIDDPWQAGAWRANHFGGTDTRWAADTVGKYEVTARRLLDAIVADPATQRILVCGNSQLTLALCTDMTQRALEHEYHAAGAATLPTITLVAENAEEYRQDHEYSRTQLGLPPDTSRVHAINERPSVPLLSSLLDGGVHVAVILVDAGVDATVGTRLAARFPVTPIYSWDPNAQGTDDRAPLVGELRTYRLSMDLPGGQAQDAWERAARLIHDRYAAEAQHRSAATLPWDQLDEFYRGSNRRQVKNALWMVESLGGHTWNTWGKPADDVPTAALRGLEPLERLRRLGFDRDTAIAMARAEHDDWCRYYRAAGWRHGPERDDARKIHDKLTDWTAVERDPNLLNAALASLAATLAKLRELGYRSQPICDDGRWQKFRRMGTVIAERRSTPWTWTTGSGDTLHADAGSWAVRDPDSGDSWSVRDDIFCATHRHDGGDRYTRLGTVTARPARAGESIRTLEGTVAAPADGWVLRGDHGDEWPVPAEEFARRYDGPIAD